MGDAVSPPPTDNEPFVPLTAQQLGLCGPLSDDPAVGPDAARHTPPADDLAAAEQLCRTRTLPGDARGALDLLLAEYDRRGAAEASLTEHWYRDRDRALQAEITGAALSGLLRGMARRASHRRQIWMSTMATTTAMINERDVLRARVAAVRALADDLDPEREMHIADAIHEALDGHAEAVSESSIHGDTVSGSNRLADGPAEAPADPHLSEWQTQMRGFLGKRVEVVLNKDPRKVVVGVLHHFDTDGQVYVEDEDGSWGWAWPCLDIAVSAGAAAAAEPARSPIEVAERAMFARRDAARLNAPGVHDLDDVLAEAGIDPAESGAPAPGYPRIADAITAACEAADIDLTVVHDGRVLDYVPGVVWLATVLDKAGLIDWTAFADETSAAPGLIGTWADPAFRAHQEHKHPTDGCGYCPSEEDR